MTISVLLIDDDSFHRQGLRTFLQLNQFQVEEADNAEAGLMMASQQDFGAAVVDIRLPQTQGARPTHHPTGIALARAIKERQPALGIVLLSAYENYGAEIAPQQSLFC